jgi:hypothetical protein
VKKVIELLEQGLNYLGKAYDANSDENSDVVLGHLNIVEISIKTALKYVEADLKALPRGETPEQWERRTGEPWPDDWAVYALYENNDGERKWFSQSYDFTKKQMRKSKTNRPIVCATEAGKPPDDWMPEEADQ